MSVDTTRVVHGQKSLRLVAEAGSKTQVRGFRSLQIPVEPGKDYRISSSAHNDSCSFHVNRIVRDSTRKTNTRVNIIPRAEASSDTWRRYEEILSVADDERYVMLIVSIAGRGTLWFDDVRIEKL